LRVLLLRIDCLSAGASRAMLFVKPARLLKPDSTGIECVENRAFGHVPA